MSRVKGSPKTGGRVKGVPNQSSQEARLTIAKFVDSNIEQLSKWLQEAYEEEGAKVALDLFSKYIGYAHPKLASTTLSGDPRNPLSMEVTSIEVRHVDAKARDTE